MQNVPDIIIVLFLVVVISAVGLFYMAAGKSTRVLAFLTFYILLQSILGIYGFYKDESAIPPRFLFLIGPGFLITAGLCFSNRGRRFLDRLDIRFLTLLHIVRLPVEIVLYYVFAAHLIPELMTFEGRNFDILSGVSAIAMYYFVFVTKQTGNKLLLIWNVICLFLLFNIVGLAVLSAQTPFQQLAFDQPNIGITYFPLVLLPAVVVPLVLISHVAAIRQLMLKSNRGK